jgi:hypothetical protein
MVEHKRIPPRWDKYKLRAVADTAMDCRAAWAVVSFVHHHVSISFTETAVIRADSLLWTLWHSQSNHIHLTITPTNLTVRLSDLWSTSWRYAQAEISAFYRTGEAFETPLIFPSCVLPTLEQARLPSVLDRMKYGCLTLEDGNDNLWWNIYSYEYAPRKYQEERGSHIRNFHQMIKFRIFLVKHVVPKRR